MTTQRRYWTRQQALDWYQNYHGEHGKLPTRTEASLLRGPSWRFIKLLGGLGGIAQTLGIADQGQLKPLRVQKTSDEELTSSLTQWALARGIDTLPHYRNAETDYRERGVPMAHPSTYKKRFGTWDGALASTGLFSFTWTASECVAHARRIKYDYPRRPNLRDALEAHSARGVTPTKADVQTYFPSLKSLSQDRIAWENWATPAASHNRKLYVSRIISHGVLTVATAGGDLRNFQEAHDAIHQEGRGPQFHKSLYANMAPEELPEARGYIWSLDLMERTFHDYIENGRLYDSGSLGLGTIGLRKLVLPVFEPEIQEWNGTTE